MSQSLNHLKLPSRNLKKFTVLKWLPQSPNHNPTNYLWDVEDVQQLYDAIMSVWPKISDECFQLFKSMPRKIKTQGGPTQY